MANIPLAGRLALIVAVGAICIGLYYIAESLAPAEEPFAGTDDAAIAELFRIDAALPDKPQNVEAPPETEVFVSVAYAGSLGPSGEVSNEKVSARARWADFKQLADTVELQEGKQNRLDFDLGFCNLTLEPQRTGSDGRYSVRFSGTDGAELAQFGVAGKGEFEARQSAPGLETQLVSADPDRRIAVYQVVDSASSGRAKPLMGCALVGEGFSDSDDIAKQLRGPRGLYPNFELYVFSPQWFEHNKIYKALDNYKRGLSVPAGYGGGGGAIGGGGACFS